MPTATINDYDLFPYIDLLFALLIQKGVPIKHARAVSIC